jgi:hypothetical protein
MAAQGLRTVRNHDGSFDLIDTRTGVVVVQGESIVVVANIRDEIEGKISPSNTECSEVAQGWLRAQAQGGR